MKNFVLWILIACVVAVVLNSVAIGLTIYSFAVHSTLAGVAWGIVALGVAFLTKRALFR